MRYLPLVGLYQNAGRGSLASGARWSTQPTEIPMNGLAVENGRVYEFVRISGTCCAGMLLYYTGPDGYVCLSGTGMKPAGVSLVSPTVSGDWSFVQKYGLCTTIHQSATFGINQASASAWSPMYALGTSGAWGKDGFISGSNSGAISAPGHYIGQCLSDAALSACVGLLTLL